MLNLKSKKVLSALLSLSLAFEPMALAENNPKNTSEQSLGNKIVQKAKKVVTHPGFYIPAGIVGAGVTYLTGKAIYNNNKYSKPRIMDGSNTSSGSIEVRDGYNSLDENEKILYDMIVENTNYENLEERKDDDTYTYSIKDKLPYQIRDFIRKYPLETTYKGYSGRDLSRLNYEERTKILRAVTLDNPDFFWLYDINIQYHVRESDEFQEKTLVECSLNSIFSKNEIESKKNELENKVNEILSQIPNRATDCEKATFIHDYICENCKYFEYPKEESDAVKWKVQTAYGCLCEGKAVCEGIARAYQLLMNRAGVECRTIYGAANEDCLVIKLSKVLDSNLNHAWNIIKINGEWRHVDVTWDLPFWYRNFILRGGKYGYFLLTNKEIQEDHRIGIPYGNGNEEIKNANGYRNCNLPKEIAKDIKVYY